MHLLPGVFGMFEKQSEYWIKTLNLKEHPEGGYYTEYYRNPAMYKQRRLATSIYFLLNSGQVSRFHRLKSDEIWYHHLGSPLRIYQLKADGQLETTVLGDQKSREPCFFSLIKGGTIFGAEVTEPESFSLISCLVTPGFDFKDFELFSKADLMAGYPDYVEIITKLT